MKNIEFFKSISAHNIFTNLYPSTLTSRGNFTNITFTEEDLIKTLQIPPIKFASILKIGCNYGEIYIYGGGGQGRTRDLLPNLSKALPTDHRAGLVKPPHPTSIELQWYSSAGIEGANLRASPPHMRTYHVTYTLAP